MKFTKLQFNSHKNHNPNYDILEGHLPTGDFITYAIKVKGDGAGKESMEYYRGENYGGQGRSYSRHFEADRIPTKYKSLWEELRKIYERKYKTDVAEGIMVSKTQKELQESAIRKIHKVLSEGTEINSGLHDILLKYEKDGLLDTIEYGFDFGEVIGMLTGKDKRDLTIFVQNIKGVHTALSAIERLKSRYESWI